MTKRTNLYFISLIYSIASYISAICGIFVFLAYNKHNNSLYCIKIFDASKIDDLLRAHQLNLCYNTTNFFTKVNIDVI